MTAVTCLDGTSRTELYRFASTPLNEVAFPARETAVWIRAGGRLNRWRGPGATSSPAGAVQTGSWNGPARAANRAAVNAPVAPYPPHRAGGRQPALKIRYKIALTVRA